MYAIFLGHLFLPAVGVPFDSATLVSVFGDLPGWFKMSAKAIVAFPAAFHTYNGLRHLSWDMGYRKFIIPSFAFSLFFFLLHTFYNGRLGLRIYCSFV
jgi:succinate dehydrogenase/fumarate reductase cytochrome b subunit